ncbi:MAG: 16S rRNA (guanine(966)-N(2))-methyltransferase RsmD [Gammaproteobacteria bacterium]|nr:16S rRNA (guanine(966)-N(2))-methyltransferase RsmD [Gammaproteobacteria bacterium]
MQQGFVRIIAGKWRGRRLKVPAIKGLRPTPDRVRETLFNWLQPLLEGAYCLDLFAGSGVLGFEALSRGAAFVEMIDESDTAINLLQTACKMLVAEKDSCIYRAKAPEGLRPLHHPFDIVFLDPPYSANLLLPCAHYLEEQHYLAKTAYIYLEAQQRIEDNELPANWKIIKNQKAGQVFYHLAYREKS